MLRVEIPAPPRVRCVDHGAVAVLVTTPRGQVRYVAQPVSQDGPPGTIDS
ncbi:MAG TPA: hypothetical protein VKV73_10565 [Chloroflexota bacterium]|nr:hypothetical protein [Chloroflexota bacterium]